MIDGLPSRAGSSYPDLRTNTVRTRAVFGRRWLRLAAVILTSIGLALPSLGWGGDQPGSLAPIPVGVAEPVASEPIEPAEVSLAATVTPLPSATLAPTATITPTPTPTPRPVPTATPRPQPLAERFQIRPGDRVASIRPGILHLRRTTSDPFQINLLLFDLTGPQFDLRTALGDGRLGSLHRTSQLVAQHNALAGVNGDLFSAARLPQGLTVVDGRVAISPKHRATFAWSRQRQPFIGYFTDDWTWTATLRAANGRRTSLSVLNAECPFNQICLVNDLLGVAAWRPGDNKVALDADGVIQTIVTGQRLVVPPGGQVLQGTGTGGQWLRDNLRVGERPIITIMTNPPLADYAQAISGGPIIVRDGQWVADCLCNLRDCSQVRDATAGLLCEEFPLDWKLSHYGASLAPRTAIGYDRARETLIVAVIDGYQPGYSRGMTPREVADLLIEFGADMGMELDSGGSTTMVLQGRVVNRPSDSTGERHVPNALVFYWHELPPAAPPLRAGQRG